MSNDNGSSIPPLPERSAADAAAHGSYAAPPYAPPSHSAPPVHGAPPAPETAPVPEGQAPSYQWAPQEPKRTKEKTGGGAKLAGLVVVAALIGGGVGLGGAWLGMSLMGDDTTPTAQPAGGSENITINNPDEVNQTAAIAAAALPSVVTIEAASQSGGGSGSGVVLSEDGYVLTNTHVVTLGGASGDAQLRVTGSDGTLYDATIVGTDPIYDLAVIKLEGASDLTPVDFADSSELNVGDTTVAIGAPMGLSNTVTTGVISNLNRSIEIASAAAPEGDDTESPDDGDSGTPWFFDLPGQDEPRQSNESIKIAVLQTDAAINPGNSGGALVDDEGKLVGINVAIATAASSSEEGGSIGLGFAIPSNIAERIATEIIDNGAATHGLLGATVAPASMMEGTTTTGAYIDDIVPDGAAEAAGLESGDVVTTFNGLRVNDAIDLTAQVRAAAAESTATITYVRDGEEHEAEVTLGTLE